MGFSKGVLLYTASAICCLHGRHKNKQQQKKKNTCWKDYTSSRQGFLLISSTTSDWCDYSHFVQVGCPLIPWLLPCLCCSWAIVCCLVKLYAAGKRKRKCKIYSFKNIFFFKYFLKDNLFHVLSQASEMENLL